MDTVRLPLLWSYYQATRPYRWWQCAREARAGRAPAIVLLYHRVADDRATPWTCSYRVFARQMRWLKRHFELVSLAEVQERIRSGKNARTCVAVTFDDGYADNCQQALPLLIREQVPCTYFVTTQYVFGQEPFPQDAALGLRLRPNTIHQLRELAAAGVSIGAHTRTHADLGQLTDPVLLRDEVVTAGEELQAALRRPVRYFAFPFGQHANLNAAAFHLAYEAGYDGVCSAYGGFNLPGEDAFHMQRVRADSDFVRLRNRVTGHPRKRGIARFEYESAPARATRAEAASR